MNENRLRDLLEQTAPDRPEVDPTSRAAAVARRGRRSRVRDRALVAGAAVALVAAAVVPLAVGWDTEDEVAYPTDSAPAVEPCPAAGVDITRLGEPVVGLGEVVAVRSCPVLGDEPSMQLTKEPLAGDAARAFAEDLAATPAWEMPSFCLVATMPNQPWALQLQNADGQLFTIGSPTRACSFVLIDGVERGVDQVIAAFEGNQVGVPDTLACPATDDDAPATWNASFDPATATAGVLCVLDRDDTWVETTLTADEVASVKDDMATNLREALGGTCDDPITTPRLLLLADDAGDQSAYLDLGCGAGFTNARGTWVPEPGTLTGLTG